MKIYFNADEVFNMAEEIERQGVRFYTKAAGMFQDPEIKPMLTKLADMEVGHEKRFAAMHAEILSQGIQAADPDEMATAYINAFTDGKVFDSKQDMCALISETSTLKDILLMALDAEKNSIAFYAGIKRLVAGEASRQTVEDIISEEMGHIVIITEKIKTI